jgi:quercetin dioxygenase-like cupin family protein
MPVKKPVVRKAEATGTIKSKRPEKSGTVGGKIRNGRTEKAISLEQIANETGFSVAHLKGIEDGNVTPSVGDLLHIARALQIDSGSLIKEQDASLKDRVTAYKKRTENYAYETLTPGCERKHLKAFRVTIEAGQDHKGVGYQHEGEEFNYVLAGKVRVTVGEHRNTLKAGDSLHFNSAIKHQLKNVGHETAEMIVVIYGP